MEAAALFRAGKRLFEVAAERGGRLRHGPRLEKDRGTVNAFMTMADGFTPADRKSWEILAGIVGEQHMNDTTTTFDTPPWRPLKSRVANG